ncbi:SRPBCC family protein [Mesorhizobium sp. C280B]|uniref:SRPBCC family protein n=1 Tax=unclassified Mesorhizobium TaxID=325217 RepID=UPI0003CE3E05|nr:SRPBCC family protein [Mesorhizobium sp. LSJC280B00]ESW82478.1 activator of HSP90 ATPase [Mesorhizobium sp. LSJC280B00]
MNQIAPVNDEHSVIHSTFTIERTYPQSPERVFLAFADKVTVRRWRVEGDGFTIAEFTFDFRVGGGEVSRFSYQGGPEIRLDAQFQDIVPDRRIVFSYRMAVGAQPLSASLTTVELAPSGEGTRLTYTEQGAFFDGVDSAQGREEGTRGLLQALAAELQKAK